MKIKQNVYITREEKFIRNPESSCYSLDPGRHMDDTWIFVGEVEFDVSDVNTSGMIESVSAEIDQKISELYNAIQVAENRKAELLALPAPEQS